MKEPAIAMQPSPSATAHWLGVAAAAAALAFAVTLSIRPISSYDIGYHLAYGEKLLTYGQIVQGNDFVYTKLPANFGQNPADTPPGGWIDQSGRYRFVNANWLSQAIMYEVYHLGGFAGLEALQVALVAGVFLLILLTLRLSGVGWPATAAALLLAALVSYERFVLRPELFGYLLLAAQWCLLSRPAFTWRKMAGVIALQLLAVNVHSYFWLGFFLVGAVWADAFARWCWAKAHGQLLPREWRAKLKWLSWTLGGCAAAALVNPWFVRGAIMPIQTVLYMRRYHIGGGRPGDIFEHPWAVIGELYWPFVPRLATTYASIALYVLLGVAAIAGVVAAARRQWASLLALIGMMAAGISVRRNMALAGLLAGPMAFVILSGLWQVARQRLAKAGRWFGGRPRTMPAFSTLVSIALLGLGLCAVYFVVTQRFYFNERRPWAFGVGPSRFSIPLGAADWLSQHRLEGRVFTDQESSSNLSFFTSPHVSVPVLTNTWAMPPSTMTTVLRVAHGQDDWRPSFDACDIQAVVLHTIYSQPLIKALARSPEWAIVNIDVKHVLFLRRAGPNADLAAKAALKPETFDVADFARQACTSEMPPAFALSNAGDTLSLLGWRDAAIALWRDCVRLKPDYAEANQQLGQELALRGGERLIQMTEAYNTGQDRHGDELRAAVLDDWRTAEQHLGQTLRLQPENTQVRQLLQAVRQAEGELSSPRTTTYPQR